MARRNRQDEDRDPLEDVASLLAPVPVPAPLLAPGYNPRFTEERLLNEIEDRRTYHPDGPYRPALQLDARPSQLQQKHQAVRQFQQPAFDTPKAVLICVRRKQRREVLFAKKKHRKGGGARRHRRNHYSNVRC